MNIPIIISEASSSALVVDRLSLEPRKGSWSSNNTNSGWGYPYLKSDNEGIIKTIGGNYIEAINEVVLQNQFNDILDLDLSIFNDTSDINSNPDVFGDIFRNIRIFCKSGILGGAFKSYNNITWNMFFTIKYNLSTSQTSIINNNNSTFSYILYNTITTNPAQIVDIGYNAATTPGFKATLNNNRFILAQKTIISHTVKGFYILE